MAATVSNLFPSEGQEPRKCEKHGPYTAHLFRFGKVRQWSNCPQCDTEQHGPGTQTADQREVREGNRDGGWIKEALATAEVPLRYTEATFENYRVTLPEQQRIYENIAGYAERFPKYRAQGTSMVFTGKTGVGKTHLGIATLKQVISVHRMSAHYTKFAKIVAAVKSSFRKGGMTEQEVYRHFLRFDLLVVDEVGVQHGSDFEQMVMTNIIDARYDDQKPTILITNLPMRRTFIDDRSIPGLADCVGDRVVDRLRENGGKTFVFDWQSARA